MKLAVIGLGAMGLPMATRLLRAGHEVIGCDLRAPARAGIEAAGGRSSQDAAAAVRAVDLVLLMVVSGAQAEALLFGGGADGAAPAMAPGTIIVASCTQPADQARALGERLAACGLRFLDAPVSGGTAGAKAGTLTVMAAGPRATFEAAEPALAVLSDKRHHLGTAWGLGSLAKTINQHLAGVHLAAAAEALAFAERAGLDAAQMLALYTQSAAASWMLNDRGPRMIEDAPEVTSTVDIFVKDMAIVLEAGRRADAALPLAEAAQRMFKAAHTAGHGTADDSQVIRAFRALGGTPAAARGAEPTAHDDDRQHQHAPRPRSKEAS